MKRRICDWFIECGLWNYSRMGYPLLDRASGPYAWPLKDFRTWLARRGRIWYALAWNDWR